MGLMLTMPLALTGCGDSSPDSTTPPPTPPPPPADLTPGASFSVTSTAPTGTAVVFDASGSSSKDGSELQYSWDFGSGLRGGGKTLARAFAASGTVTVTLTVTDGAGRKATQSKSVVITSASATPPTAVTAEGRITTLDGMPLSGVAATPFGSTSSVSTDALGKVHVSVSAGEPLVVKLAKDGFADQFVKVTLPTIAGADAYFDAVMRPRDAALTLADAAAGGSLNARDGATITLPANALVDATGAAVTGSARIAVTPVDVTLPGAGGFPGAFDGIQPDGTSTPIVSFGTTEFVLAGSDGRALQIAPGKTAIIEVPLYATKKTDGTPLVAGDTTPLWSLDETTGIWVQEGTGTVVASTGSPSGLAMRATVSHFTWWNSDIGFDPYGPKPKCEAATDIGIPGASDSFANATICNMLAEIDRTLGGNGANAVVGKVTAKAVAPLVGSLVDSLVEPLADPLPPLVAGYSRRTSVPIAGGVTIPVPANVNIVLNASALNGTWTGSTVVNGPVGEQADVIIKLRPLQSSGDGTEMVTLPFDGTRALDAGKAARFQFTGAPPRYVRVTTTAANGSAMTGSVRVLQGTTVLGTQTFGRSEAPLVSMLPSATTYVVEVTNTSALAGGYRLQIELTGGSQSEAVTVPFDVTRSVADYTTQYLNFDVPPGGYAGFVAFQQQGNQSAAAMLTGPNGFSRTVGTASVANSDAEVALTDLGAYSLAVSSSDGRATAFRATMEKTAWTTVGPPLEGITSIHQLVDLVSDRNNAPVVGQIRTFAVGQTVSAALALKRWTGTVWESVGPELIIDRPCTDTMERFAFDSTNTPLVIYGSYDGTTSHSAVRKLVNGAWTAVGPNEGKLPRTDSFDGACRLPPIVQVGPNDQPVVAYASNDSISVQTFDGTSWSDLVPGQSSFSALSASFELRVDPIARIWFVLANPNGVVRRFRATPTPGWDFIGPNDGALPNTANTLGFDSPRMRFDPGSFPYVAASANVTTTPGTSSSGVVVYRFDGTQWLTSGSYQTGGSNPYSAGGRYLGFAVLDGAPVVSWLNNTSERSNIVYVQRNSTSSGWTPIGVGNGEIPQYSPHGITTRQAWQTRMVAIGSDLYLALTVSSTSGNTVPFRIYLLKKAAE